MGKIYLVTDNINYEGYGIIKAFTSKDEACKLRDLLEEYDKSRVPPPPIEDDWTEWEIQNKTWEENHPAGSSSADYYRVIETELD